MPNPTQQTQKIAPKRTDIHTILLIGSGPIVIGQACEFDYSGTQAVKTLKSLGYRVVLINSNPATIMTDPDFADRTYIEPITEEIIADIIKREKVDAILPTMGGQTALNVAMSMYEKGMLEGIEFLGAKPSAIKKGEDRQAFKEAMLKIGMDLPKSRYAYTEEEALEAAKEIGFPLIIRASFTLAGGGSGVAYNIDEFKAVAKNGLETSPINEILIEESLLGWKEYEMEVIRDKFDNCIIVCSIENLDPMGVHTGDSITIAPALTLTDKEYQRMRDASFKILREIGVDTGGSNVQFAINPKNGRMTVIEMNPRVSRSSALASKATGYPIAKVATMLAVGFSLDEIKNDITGTPASFEPSIDYIVTKIPRFTFEKFPQADSTLTTSMKSIGEVMAIGGSFKESLQKALCSLETGIFGLNQICNDLEIIKKEIRRPNANRLLYIAEGFGLGMSIDEMHELCKIDKWFLHEIKEIVDSESSITSQILSDESLMRRIKSYGFSDKMIAHWLKHNDGMEISESEVYQARIGLGVECVYNEVDTCAAEFPSLTPYLYSTIGNFMSVGNSAFTRSFGEFENSLCGSPLRLASAKFSAQPQNLTQNPRIADSVNTECQDSSDMDSSNTENSSIVSEVRGLSKNCAETSLKGCRTNNSADSRETHHETNFSKVMIIGGGPNRIGQGIEFDYCCVHSSFALNDLGIKSIMYNCNPETVSTDYDTSDVLYFEPIDFERVRAVIEREKPDGIIVHFGGQTPLKLANSLTKINAKIIGTSAKVIDTAEDREKFASFVNTLGLKQPQNGIAYEKEQAYSVANKIGFPVLVRPSYVLGGRAMRIVYDDDELKQYMDEVIAVSDSSPVLIDKFLEYAIELDVDCISDGESVYIGGIMEHIEEAGIHSGDSASSLPTINIRESMLKEIEQSTAKIALKLGVVGLMNVQYAIYNNELYLIEVNPRASRTVPFVSKATGLPLAKIATRVMWNHSVKKAESKDSILEEALRFYDKYNMVKEVGCVDMESLNSDSKTNKIFTHKPLKHFSVKESVFPFNKLPGADLLLGPEMKSTGEVMGMGKSFAFAFDKSQSACKNPLPKKGKIFISLRNSDKKHAAGLAKTLQEIGFEIVATLGTHKILSEAGIEAKAVLKVSEGRPHINDMIANHEIDMVINTSSNKAKPDARLIREAVLRANIPYFTTISGAKSAAIAMQANSNDNENTRVSTKALQDYLNE
ncbi:carbamoyl-phosphate synthase large subunit [Helicobacter bilis]|uniref:Carbamoyl phosphate synthase large chain n=1 Tax=Helicobacter bilis TaxID=37372 RepID=A0A4U8U8A7_9HELI|nr:carbamoyl-phosphate synthase large subunit [Helicobacter bilis]MCI7410604.1 carbamoyl-phosphate synthase large subunit [Helicobacter bilis]MDD7296022.1 carbamoyl-phosphate synthase large subunit [Helicobacter bilis]MDY4398993.1 carbamoyl-phosphate synthase large subunit [Helicobacter bilis]TLE07068.1 carbamoyl-phosphate synthase large subunit [Helicobacter bilis]TLE08053.1 carbamoyl-phosphate synthase large subunit [Helicobacter bilis]